MYKTQRLEVSGAVVVRSLGVKGLRMRGSYTLTPPYSLMKCTGKKLYLLQYKKRNTRILFPSDSEPQNTSALNVLHVCDCHALK